MNISLVDVWLQMMYYGATVITRELISSEAATILSQAYKPRKVEYRMRSCTACHHSLSQNRQSRLPLQPGGHVNRQAAALQATPWCSQSHTQHFTARSLKALLVARLCRKLFSSSKTQEVQSFDRSAHSHRKTTLTSRLALSQPWLSL